MTLQKLQKKFLSTVEATIEFVKDIPLERKVEGYKAAKYFSEREEGDERKGNLPQKGFRCMKHEFEIGKEYSVSGEIAFCFNGFHFCETPNDVISYYSLEPDTFFFKCVGRKVLKSKNENKVVARYITLKELIPTFDYLKLINRYPNVSEKVLSKRTIRGYNFIFNTPTVFEDFNNSKREQKFSVAIFKYGRYMKLIVVLNKVYDK